MLGLLVFVYAKKTSRFMRNYKLFNILGGITMKEKMQKVKTFVKEHKTEIASGAVAVVSGMVIYMVTKKEPKLKITEGVNLLQNPCTELEHPELDFGTITDFWLEGGYKNAIIKDLTIGDLGALGEQFVTKVDGITKDTGVSLVMGLE